MIRCPPLNKLLVAFRMSTEHKTHVLRGLHSGIPICCIAFFVTTYFPRWRSGFAGNRLDWRYARGHMRRNHEVARQLGDKPPSYVPCPACVRAKTFVRIHLCTDRCAGQPGASIDRLERRERKRRIRGK